MSKAIEKAEIRNVRKGVMEMDDDKKLWLESINAKAFPEPITYFYTFPGYHGGFNLSEKYINETPLNELQETYKRNEKYVWSLLHREDDRGISAKVLDVFKKPVRFKIFKRFRNFFSRKA